MITESISVIPRIEAEIQAFEEDNTLFEDINFNNRANAIDHIEFHIIDRIEGLKQHAALKNDLETVKQHAENLKYSLEKIDTNLFNQLREKIRRGICTKSSFTKMIHKYLGNNFADHDHPYKPGYDNADIFINGLLSGQAIPDPNMERKPGMVFYQKTPARIVFEMAERAQSGPDDVFFDLGSGLGQPAILVNLISGVTARGIEQDPAYCSYARTSAALLNLSNVEFINADARYGDYSGGTIFFLYTPFEGTMLQDMLGILQRESGNRMIRIFTWGPCSPHVARQSWLFCVNGTVENDYKLYEFRSLDAENDSIRSQKFLRSGQ